MKILFSIMLCLTGVCLSGAEVIGEDSMLAHLQVFFNSWSRTNHGGTGAHKTTQLFGRQIQFHIYKKTPMHLTKEFQVEVSITDVATGISVSKTYKAATEQEAVMNGGTVAAHELFTALERMGLVKLSQIVVGNQIQLCDDKMRKKTCDSYKGRGMCAQAHWSRFMKENCFFTCFNCGKGWN